MNPPTLYETTLKINTLRALLCLRLNDMAAAGRIAATELEVYEVYELIGNDRRSWIDPLINVCRGITMLVDEREDGGRFFNTQQVWPRIMRSFSEFETVHGDQI